MKKNFFHGIALDMVWEPKETGNFIFEEKKKQTWLCLRAKRQKKRENGIFLKNLHIFVILGAKTKVMKRKNTLNEFDILFHSFYNL